MTILDRIRREPVLLSQAAAVIIGLCAAWGLSLTEAQTASVMAALAFVGAVIGRGHVTPTVDVAAHTGPDRSEVTAGPAAPEVSDATEGQDVDVIPVEEPDAATERYPGPSRGH